MKKIITLAIAALAFFGFNGCKSVPTVENMYTISYAVGIASGLVANEIKMDDSVHNGIIEVWGKVTECVPETNQTFEAAWTPIAQRHTDELVKAGKIDAGQATLIMLGFKTAVTGLDYVFVKYPKAKEYKDLTVAAIDGFSAGFLTAFKPVNASLGGCASDKEAYDYIKAKVEGK